MSDLDAEIVALRVSGLSEPEICARLPADANFPSRVGADKRQL
jgi:hypothetical protein